MGIWKFLSWRQRHWDQTGKQAIREFVDRSREVQDKPLRNWTIAFLVAASNWLEYVFLDRDGKDAETSERLGSLTKESFRSLYSILLCHHLAVCREDQPVFPSRIDAISVILKVLQSSIEQRIDVYSGLSDLQASYHLNREIAQVLGISETNLIAARYWTHAVNCIAQAASESSDATGELLDANP